MYQNTAGWYCPSCRTSTRIFSGIIDTHKEEWKKLAERLINEAMQDKQEEPTMKVSYNGFTGELVKMERKTPLGVYVYTDYHIEYDLSIYDHEKKVTHSFTNVNLKDVKFLSGSVSFD